MKNINRRYILSLAGLLLIAAALTVRSPLVNDTEDLSASVYRPQISKEDQDKQVSLLQDRLLTRGVLVKDPTLLRTETGETHTVGGIECPVYTESWTNKTHELNFANKEDGKDPLWQVSQWHSRANLYEHHGVKINDGTFAWENWYKRLVLGKLGYGHRFVTMRVNGAREYKGIWGGDADPCFEKQHPHLLISQNPSIAKKPSVGEMEKLFFTMIARLTHLYITPERNAQWDKSQHTAHFVTHLDFQNIREDKDKEKGHGQSFAIGVNFYDARIDPKYYEKQVFIHKPRERVILYIPMDELSPDALPALRRGQWAGFDKVDILPYVKEAFATAVAEGKSNDSVQKLVSEDLNDYHMTAARYGWEVSSLHDVEMHLADFKVIAVPK